MLLRRITVQNLGPIDDCDFELPFHENGNPKPIILVGENGTGKSILLSLVVNFLLVSKQLIYDDTEIEKQRVYKLRSPLYITTGKHYYLAKLIFDEGFRSVEWQLLVPRKQFEADFGYTPNDSDWNKIPESEPSHFWSSCPENTEMLKGLMDENTLLYFPANRFEEPAWLNLANLMSTAEYSDLEHLVDISNRRIIHYAPLKINQDWLMDVLFDRNILEGRIQNVRLPIKDGEDFNVPIFAGYDGSSSRIYESVQSLLKVIFGTEDIRLGFGDRSFRQVSIMRNEQKWIPNLFQLSTGQALVFDLFLTIIRDYDLTKSNFSSLSEVRGLVLIDEIELHLHSSFQYEVLPRLIKMFPKVQFIISSHSPLFLLGMQRELTDDGFCILQTPSGRQIATEEFAEFENAYSCFRETRSHAEAIEAELSQSRKPIIFVEGDYDIRYLRKAAQVFGKEELLEKFSLQDAEGFGNLNTVWKNFNSRLALATSPRVILLFDCDANKEECVKGNVIRKVIPTQENTPIRKGIENLFPAETIDKAGAHKRAFIDVTPETVKVVRGQDVTVPALKEVNKDEKGNLCDWLCETGTERDFVNFDQVFALLEDLLVLDQPNVE